MDTGYLVCRDRCLDDPQQQFRTLILPPDPVPRQNPRQSYDVTYPWPIGTIAGPTSPQNQGFTQYVLDSVVDANYPTLKPDVLAQIAKITGIPIPVDISDASTVISKANTTLAVLAPNPLRTYLLLYSPVVPVAQISKATAVLGAQQNLQIGPGQAWFWADLQELAPTWKGGITAIGLTAGMPIFAWEAPGSSTPLVTPDGSDLVTPDGSQLILGFS